MRKKKDSGEANTNEWIVTYSDTVTLLLCFFVLLFSFSSVNENKWKQIVESFAGMGTGASNVKVDNASGIIGLSSDSKFDPEDFEAPEDKLYRSVKNYIDKNKLNKHIELLKKDNVITLRFRDTVLFDPDSTVLREDGKAILKKVCYILKDSMNLIKMIEIEGHTAAPLKGQPEFKDTFEFSSERALKVLRYALDIQKMDPLRLKAVGYGQYHPIASNLKEETRKINRRVEFVVTSIDSSKLESTITINSSKNGG